MIIFLVDFARWRTEKNIGTAICFSKKNCVSVFCRGRVFYQLYHMGIVKVVGFF